MSFLCVQVAFKIAVKKYGGDIKNKEFTLADR